MIKILSFSLMLLFVSCGDKQRDEWSYLHKNDTVKMKFHYMMYACGDCYAEYKLKEVLSAKNDYSNLVSKDFFVKFNDKSLEDSLEINTSMCKICYTFIYEGKVQKSKSGEYRLEVLRGEALLPDSSCCED